MGVLFANRFKTTLSAGVLAGDTALPLSSVAGLPAIGGTNYCYLTLVSADQQTIEVVKATAVAGNTLTVVRAQEGTAAVAWAQGIPVELRLTTQALLDALAERLGVHAAADAALKLATPRAVTMTGDVAWSVNFDGSADASAAGTIAAKAVSNAKLADMTIAGVKGALAAGGTTDLTVSNVRTLLSITNVENKDSATIRSELTSANVTGALGFTPEVAGTCLPLTGGVVGDLTAANITATGALLNMTAAPSGTVTIRHTGAAGGSLVLENTGGTCGTSRLTILSETGANGAIFESGNIDLVDFIFKSPSGQRNIRYEARAGSFVGGNSAWEFQFGINADSLPVFAIGDSQIWTNKPIVADGTVTASNGQLLGASDKGIANGVAPLGADGKIASAYLPSYVDDVIEATNYAALPNPGETGKIYVTLDTNGEYRWSGSAYVQLVASPGSTDAVPEGSINLYFTNARAAAAAPVQSVAGKTGAVALAKSDVGLANVDNTSDTNKPVSTAQQAALDAKRNIALNIQSVASAATVTPDASNDVVEITALATNLLIANPTGTPTDGWGMVIRIKDNGTARTISYQANYRAVGITVPRTTVAGKTLYIGLVYNSADMVWDAIATAQES